MAAKSKFEFLASPRFWQLFLIGLTAALEEYNRTGQVERALLIGVGLWLGGSVTVGTTEKIAEKLGS